jgi:L-rhamnonate dehydratase
VTEVRRVAALAHAYNKPLSDAGAGGIFSLHHVAGFQAGTLAERHMGIDYIENFLFPGLPKVEGGMLALPDGPGWGVNINRDLLNETVVND